MAKYEIFAGLGGGFGGAQSQGIFEYESAEAAESAAYDLACQEYEGYEGMHGVASVADIEGDPEYYGLDEDFSEEDVCEIYEQEKEGWIEYWAVLVEE